MLRLEARAHKLLQFDSVSEDGKSPEPDFWVAASNTITYIKTTAAAAKRTVISLIKSPARVKREKRPQHSLRPTTLKPDSSSHKGIALTAEDTRLIHYPGGRWNYAVKELHWVCSVCVCVEQKQTLHPRVFLRQLLGHKQTK